MRGDQTGAGQHFRFEHLQGQIEALHLAALALKPRGWLGQAERLAAKFVRIDENNFHACQIPENGDVMSSWVQLQPL
jgi:hypothetical protein